MGVRRPPCTLVALLVLGVWGLRSFLSFTAQQQRSSGLLPPSQNAPAHPTGVSWGRWVAPAPAAVWSVTEGDCPEVLCLLPERPRRSDEAPPGVFTFLLEEQNRSRATRAEVSPDESQSRVLRMLPGAIRAPAGSDPMALLRTVYDFARTRADEWGMRLDPFEQQREMLQVVTYVKGDWYGEHRDTVWFDGNNVGVTDRRQRLVTVLVQMSRAGVDYGGGSLQYQSSTADGVWVNAPGDEGAAVLFPSHLTPHRVRTVAWGRRNVLVWWIWGKFEKNAMTSAVQCKYYVSGACTKGERCPFAHSFSAVANTVCKFYLQGNCAYGNKCRFDHKRPQAKAAPKPRAVAPPPPPPPLPPGPPPAAAPSQAVPTWRGWGGATTTSPSAVEKERAGAGERRDTSAEELSLWDDPHAATTPFEERPLCSMALKGACPRGDACPYLHGEVCPGCGKECLHPFSTQQREAHEAECARERRAEERAAASEAVECGICLEVVMQKERLSERRFGLLPGCAHAFCLGCIRGWRSSSTTGTTSEAVRTCPLCRETSYFVVPSAVWPVDAEHRQELCGAFRAKTAAIPCRHFDLGKGTCPFGTSCFYAHRYADGSEAERAPSLRFTLNADGGSDVIQPVRLSSFLD